MPVCPDNKKIEFIGRIVSVEEQDGAYIVALADKADEPNQYIVLQRAIDEDEQDARLGLDTYFVEVCACDCSGYGGVQQARLYHDRLELSLLPTNEYAAGLEEIIVWLGLPTSETNRLAKQLALIFRNTDCTVVQ